MSKRQKSLVKSTNSKIKKRVLPMLRPARLKCEVHKFRVKKRKK